MSKQTIRPLAVLSTTAGLLFVLSPLAAAAPPLQPNNTFPPSYYGFSPGYYGPYYPGQYQYGNVNPGTYNNYSSGYGPSYQPSYGRSNGVPVPYSSQLYGSPPTFGSTPPMYVPSDSSYGYRGPISTAPASRTPARDDAQVQAEVHLPTPNAELWVEGRRTSSIGTWRRFLSPPLLPGERYVYEFRARWIDNGREVVRSRQVVVRAGQRIIVDFTIPPRDGTESMPLQTPARSPG